MPKRNFNLYSGYLDLPNTTKSIHYIFEESKRDPENDPVVIWLNGGPGCSSILGWTTELGAFLNLEEDKFVPNDFSWNSISNMLYFEAPGK